MTIHTSLVDGVPVFWVGGPHPFTASLLFRAGVRDETFTTAGTTHLVEHLAMSAATRRRWETQASVEMTITEFNAEGRHEDVVEFLRRLCLSLTSLPFDRLPIERRILEAEGGSPIPPVAAEHLRHRFGLSGLGLAGVAPPALDLVEAADLDRFARMYFTRGNAALVLSGPPPRGLCLPLPDGDSRPVPPDLRRNAGNSGWFELVDEALGLSFVVDASTPLAREATDAICRIAHERGYAELRERQGWIYDLDREAFGSQDGSATVCFEFDPPGSHADDVRREMTRILRDLRDVGPSTAELNNDREALADHLNDPNGRFSEAMDAATAHLVGEPHISRAEQLRVNQTLTIDDCRAVLQALDATMMIGMPNGVVPDDPNLLPATESSVAVTGESFGRHVRGLFLSVPRGTRLIVGDEGVSCIEPNETLTVRWDDLVGAEVGEDRLTLFGADGTALPVSSMWFRNGAAALESINRRVDPSLRFPEVADGMVRGEEIEAASRRDR